jgi:hypothetical protein
LHKRFVHQSPLQHGGEDGMALHDDTGFLELPALLNDDSGSFVLPEELIDRMLEHDSAHSGVVSTREAEQPNLFSRSPFFISEREAARMDQVVQAIETVVCTPEYAEHALSWAPNSANFDPVVRGVFFGYDFHIGGAYPQLIEVNTNAGGALLNTALARTCRRHWAEHQGRLLAGPDMDKVESDFISMFRKEWYSSGSRQPLSCVAIVDQDPDKQFLKVEFHQFQKLFEKHGISAVVADPTELALYPDGLWCAGQKIDMIYNRLTDFALEEPSNSHIRSAYLDRQVVVTPNPRAHALYADKRNLVLLSDDALLRSWRIPESTRKVLRAGIPRTFLVTPSSADELWRLRRKLFFKPANGYGSKAAYRGDKLTKRVWRQIVSHQYVAQEIIPSGRRHLLVGEQTMSFKVDIRSYVYAGQTQLLAARLYRGQTTNFRTIGGGFAAVYLVEDHGKSQFDTSRFHAGDDYFISH